MDEKYLVSLAQAKILAELEERIGKSLPHVEKIEYDTVGFHVEKKNVIGIGLYQCGLTALPESFGKFHSLEKLRIKGNKLTAIPKSIHKLKSLQTLHLGDNQLRELPKSFGRLKSLKKLWINNNQLRTLPESFGNLKSLRELDLNHNKLTSLPESFGDLISLQKQDLDNNLLNALPNSFGDLKSLQTLNLWNNKLTSLPESFGNLISLQNLILTSNMLTTLPESFGNLKSLQELYLNLNQLRTLPESFGELKSLQILSLKDNQLTILPKSFWRLQNLKTLELSKNRWEGEWTGIDEYNVSHVLEFSRKIAPITTFISYSKDDQEKYSIINLKENLKKCKEISKVYTSGDEKIPESHLLLFIATEKFINSKDCLYELGLALSYNIEIIPIKGADIDFKKLKQIDLKKVGYGYLDLSQKKGLEFDDNNVKEFCNDLYKYIKKFKREFNLFETRKEKIEMVKEKYEKLIEEFIESEEFRGNLKENLTQIKKIRRDLDIKQISIIEFINQCDKILNKKT